jgi:YVTN family beta-propeller protein
MAGQKCLKAGRIAVIAFLTALTSIAQGWAYEVWVTNQDDHTVSIIDTETNKVIATITPGGKKPHNVAFSHDAPMPSLPMWGPTT